MLKVVINQKTLVPIFFTENVLLPLNLNAKAIISKSKNKHWNDLFKKFGHRESGLKGPLVIGLVPAVKDNKITKETTGVMAFTNRLAWETSSSNISLLVTTVCRFRFVDPANVTNEADVALINEDFDPRSSSIKELWKSFSDLLKDLNAGKSFFREDVSSRNMIYIVDVLPQILSFSRQDKIDLLNALEFEDRLAKLYKKLKIMADAKDLCLNTLKSIKPPQTLYPYASNDLVPKTFAIRSSGHDNTRVDEIEREIREAHLPEIAADVAKVELDKLRNMTAYNPEHIVTYNYLKLLVSLPWNKVSERIVNLDEAREGLDQKHYSMEKVKQRILEFLAVKQLKMNDLSGPILCFVGPPGVGKTSIGHSIANILGRKFQRICLGGVDNPAELRGHRRTYIGSMAGRIIQALQMAGTKDPVILLDEIDKLGYGVKGDPVSTLLEILDPEQNKTFTDHYLSIPFDLSQVIFIATANSTDKMSRALKDRLEIIETSGYSDEEKIEIAKMHLIPKQVKMHGLDEDSLNLSDDSIRFLIRGYTMESGVRSVERKIAALCRRVALLTAKSETNKLSLHLTKDDIVKILGSPKDMDDAARVSVLPGIAVGLCYTETGGYVLFVETSKIHGDGKLLITGNLGNILVESAQIALHWVRSCAHQYGICEFGKDVAKNYDIHIHIPVGAVSKDGPSAGITLATALLSLFAEVPISPGIAMSGELSLQGMVLPVGGLREKILAAKRNGYKKIIVPKKSNVYDSLEPEDLNGVELLEVTHMSEVIDIAFSGRLSENLPLLSKL